MERTFAALGIGVHHFGPVRVKCLNRRAFLWFLTDESLATTSRSAHVLPSWNEGHPEQALLDFVHQVTTVGSPQFAFALDRVRALIG